LALLTLNWRTRHGKVPSHWFSLFILLAPIQVLIAYSHGTEALLRSGTYPQLTQMALHTAVAWISLSTGLLSARPTSGFMATLFADTYSAAIFRRVLPIAVVTPIALAWISVLAEKWNLYHPGFGTSFLALLITLVLVVFVWRTYFNLGEYEQKLSLALEARDEFLSIASHDLKTPLTSLTLQLQMNERNLKNNSDPVELTESIQLSLRQVRSLTGLVNDLLDVSRIQSGNLLLDQSEMDLSMLVREVGARFSHELRAAQCNLELQLEQGLVGTWDAPRLEQVIVNLISNSIKYAPRSPLKISTERNSTHAILIVSDQGPGIAKEKREAIFERFERANVHKNVSGMGLGLFIVKKIVEAHKGTIFLESEVGRGSEFIVRLPIGGHTTFGKDGSDSG
jgi:signal transduction histidine kinase